MANSPWKTVLSNGAVCIKLLSSWSICLIYSQNWAHIQIWIVPRFLLGSLWLLPSHCPWSPLLFSCSPFAVVYAHILSHHLHVTKSAGAKVMPLITQRGLRTTHTSSLKSQILTGLVWGDQLYAEVAMKICALWIGLFQSRQQKAILWGNHTDFHFLSGLLVSLNA